MCKQEESWRTGRKAVALGYWRDQYIFLLKKTRLAPAKPSNCSEILSTWNTPKCLLSDLADHLVSSNEITVFFSWNEGHKGTLIDGCLACYGPPYWPATWFIQVPKQTKQKLALPSFDSTQGQRSYKAKFPRPCTIQIGQLISGEIQMRCSWEKL